MNSYKLLSSPQLISSDLLLYCFQLCFSSDFANFFHRFQNEFSGFHPASQFLCPSSFGGKCMASVSPVQVSFLPQNLGFGAGLGACFNFAFKVSTIRGQFGSCHFFPGKLR